MYSSLFYFPCQRPVSIQCFLVLRKGIARHARIWPERRICEHMASCPHWHPSVQTSELSIVTREHGDAKFTKYVNFRFLSLGCQPEGACSSGKLGAEQVISVAGMQGPYGQLPSLTPAWSLFRTAEQSLQSASITVSNQNLPKIAPGFELFQLCLFVPEYLFSTSPSGVYQGRHSLVIARSRSLTEYLVTVSEHTESRSPLQKISSNLCQIISLIPMLGNYLLNFHCAWWKA